MANIVSGGIFSTEILEERPGILIFKVTGPGAPEAFQNEAGGMRWQRIPPTEKRGRVHTSTVTVAILPVPTEVQVQVDPRDLDWSVARGSGPGGQHRNVTASAVRLAHQPSGITVCCESERSQHRNRESALTVLRARLLERAQNQAQGSRNKRRKRQLGSGMRGDKVRTIALQRGIVTDHRTGKKIPARRYLRGEW
jgi:peptide chain release factor 1